MSRFLPERPLRPMRAAFLAAALIATEAVGQPALLDFLAESIEFRLDWDAYANDEAKLSIELCNAGICELFVSNNPNLESFVAFVDGYVVFASRYGDLRAINRRDDGRIAPIAYIEKRLSDIEARDVLIPECGSTLTPEAISCSLSALVNSLAVSKFIVRYDEERVQWADEGWRARQFDAQAIASNLKWSSEFVSLSPAIVVEN